MILKRRAVFSLASVAVLVLGSAVVLGKGASIGIYAIVDKVVLEPDEKSPERILIWGTFVVPVPMSSGKYKAPQRGYLYFKIAPGMEQAAKQEWHNLKDVAGTGQCIGFANYWVANPADRFGNPHHSLEIQVHRDGDSAVPDLYPAPHARGIVKTGYKAYPDFESIATTLSRAARD